MRKGKSPLLFYFRRNLIIITLFLLLFSTYSCDSTQKKYADTIRHYSLEYDLDPAVVFAVIETESHFNPVAISPVGAVGIMQIMPNTARWIASYLLLENYFDEYLLDPEINIRYGTRYLSYLFSVFDEMWQGIAAYNAGEGTVKGWLNQGGITRETIPIAETATYVDRVERALSRYRSKKYASFD